MALDEEFFAIGIFIGILFGITAIKISYGFAIILWLLSLFIFIFIRLNKLQTKKE